MQKQLKKSEKTSSTVSTKVKTMFEEAKQMPVKELKTFRTVKLVMKSCCGCGCSDVTVLRTVPSDSPLRDGDRIKTTEKNDRIL